ncbi:hypothetical protein NDU88_007413 [Pleurodeles waltl]|uniref:Uncharacterized protein n=1 Tax=Pleurodeles waltl TaxID=8319 RepID=A0AAV7RUW6_PLEWA|nr:hypothetical protein NDU88_007413 [Pleurodeles waltl]
MSSRRVTKVQGSDARGVPVSTESAPNNEGSEAHRASVSCAACARGAQGLGPLLDMGCDNPEMRGRKPGKCKKV